MLTMEQQQLVTDNIRLAYKYVHSMLRKGVPLAFMRMDEDDLFSIAKLALCEAASEYNPDLGYAFSTYFYTVCFHKFRMIFREACTKKRRPYHESVSLNAPMRSVEYAVLMDILPSDELIPEEKLVERQQQTYLRFIVRYALPEDQRHILYQYYWKGMRQPEIARMRGMAQASVSRKLSRAYKTIAEKMNEAGYGC